MNPYRLINTVERDQLRQGFLAAIDDWNQLYSLNPLELSVSVPPKEYVDTLSYMINDHQGKPLACLGSEFHSMINDALFGEQDPAFNSCSEELFMLLLAELFHTESCTLTAYKQEINWLYPGSTCLALQIRCNSLFVPFLINPEWTYQALINHEQSRSSLIPLDDALAEHSLTLHVELGSMTLTMKQLCDLNVGDVIRTDHQQNNHMQLLYETKPFAIAELGLMAEHKSIKIKEFL